MKKALARLALVFAGVMILLLALNPNKTHAISRVVMTMSLNNKETGDVIWTGEATGANGNVQDRFNPTLADIGLSRASDLRINVEINEPPGSQVQLTELDLVIYAQTPTCV